MIISAFDIELIPDWNKFRMHIAGSRMDRFQELNAFIAVVEAGGFSAAARRLGESQSAISKAVNALEKRLGVALLHRSTRKVTLTDQGQLYYERMGPLVDEIQVADNELTSTTLDVSGLIRIAAPSTFGRLHVLPLIPALLAQHPACGSIWFFPTPYAIWWKTGSILRFA